MSNDVYFTKAYQREVQQRDEDPMRRIDSRSAGSGLPAYVSRSPTSPHPRTYSPVKTSTQGASYNGYASRPASSHVATMTADANQSPRGPSSHSPSNGMSQSNRTSQTAREQGSSTYYDPTSEHRDGPVGWNGTSYGGPSSMMVSTIVRVMPASVPHPPTRFLFADMSNEAGPRKHNIPRRRTRSPP